ncbi:hypothetical protein [Noviherbaspirillum galbum]|uniref:Uncharacterized protein n=1 Tax=Noviherbaspirillum galbum TaxID=2709383 RepID=A0A6B3SWM7_9BURK|nr:hypothetical protein [Noviherbaspirillum galbum]NEX62812.1 hypothetical protein [Noviherbaspirillum galbum]
MTPRVSNSGTPRQQPAAAPTRNERPGPAITMTPSTLNPRRDRQAASFPVLPSPAGFRLPSRLDGNVPLEISPEQHRSPYKFAFGRFFTVCRELDIPISSLRNGPGKTGFVEQGYSFSATFTKTHCTKVPGPGGKPIRIYSESSVEVVANTGGNAHGGSYFKAVRQPGARVIARFGREGSFAPHETTRHDDLRVPGKDRLDKTQGARVGKATPTRPVFLPGDKGNFKRLLVDAVHDDPEFVFRMFVEKSGGESWREFFGRLKKGRTDEVGEEGQTVRRLDLGDVA